MGGLGSVFGVAGWRVGLLVFATASLCLAIAAPRAKFYSLLLAVDHAVAPGAQGPSCTQLATERYFPQTRAQWRAALAEKAPSAAAQKRTISHEVVANVLVGAEEAEAKLERLLARKRDGARAAD